MNGAEIGESVFRCGVRNQEPQGTVKVSPSTSRFGSPEKKKFEPGAGWDGQEWTRTQSPSDRNPEHKGRRENKATGQNKGK